MAGTDRRRASEWTARIAEALETAQEALAADAIARRVDAFETVARGRVGGGAVYDAFRRLLARRRGESYRGSHGEFE